MSARRRRTRRAAAVLAVLTLAVPVLPGVATARPMSDGAGPRAERFANPPAVTVANPPQEKFVNPPAVTVANPPQEKFVNPPAGLDAGPSEPAPTVIRTVVQDDAVQVLPIMLAGTALLIAIGGAGYALRVAPRRRLGGQH